MVLMRVLVCCAMLSLLASCGSIEFELPNGFLEVRNEQNNAKATTADGARLWIRDFANPHEGSLEFWADAIEHDFVRNRGYELIERALIRDGRGDEGVLQSYKTDAQGEAHGYLVAMFVRDQAVRVAEFVAPTEVFATYAPSVRAAFATIR